MIQAGVLRDMSEGVLLIRPNGVISLVNPAAERILERTAADLIGRSFARSFFIYEQNDDFNQAILDAVYDPNAKQENIVPYYTGKTLRQLHITTSYLRNGPERTGIIAVLSDISELAELRDAVQAMGRIQALNRRLELRNRLLRETFGRYLSDELVRQLLDTPDGLAIGGKKLRISILMSDLRGFTALSEQIPPQVLIRMLNHYLEEMTPIIEHRGGTIIEFVGDGILAIFGAPLPSDTHAADAAAAAVEMQARMESVNAWNRGQGFAALEMGIGVHTGEAIVGNVGSEKRTRYNVIGSPVNLCGRIESCTVGGQVLISRTTREAIAAPLQIAHTLTISPKGISEPVALYQITEVGAPYGVSCPQTEEAPTPLRTPQATRLWKIREKQVDSEAAPCRLLAAGETTLLLETETELHPLGDIRLEAGGGLLCKVLARRGEGWLVRCTAGTDALSTWREQLSRDGRNEEP